MANAHYFRNGQRRVQQVPVATGTIIWIGDMIFLSTAEAKAAIDFTWNSDLATTQAGFADLFLGIAMQSTTTGQTDDIDYDSSADSVYEYPVASATYALGVKLGPDKASGNTLLSQVLETAVATSSVAACLRVRAAAVTTLEVSFASPYNPSANSVAGVIG